MKCALNLNIDDVLLKESLKQNTSGKEKHPKEYGTIEGMKQTLKPFSHTYWSFKIKCNQLPAQHPKGMEQQEEPVSCWQNRNMSAPKILDIHVVIDLNSYNQSY